MDYSSIQMAISSGIDLRQILKELASMSLESQTLTKINIVQEQITDMISVLISTQGELIKLLIENGELRQKVKSRMGYRDRTRNFAQAFWKDSFVSGNQAGGQYGQVIPLGEGRKGTRQ